MLNTFVSFNENIRSIEESVCRKSIWWSLWWAHSDYVCISIERMSTLLYTRFRSTVKFVMISTSVHLTWTTEMGELLKFLVFGEKESVDRITQCCKSVRQGRFPTYENMWESWDLRISYCFTTSRVSSQVGGLKWFLFRLSQLLLEYETRN